MVLQGMVTRLERGADLHMAQLMPLPLTVCCFRKIQIGFTFLVPAPDMELGSLGNRVNGSFGSSFTSGLPGHHFDPV